MNIILGISAYYHDSAAALLIDGSIVAVAQEERFTRKKHDPSFPRQAIRYVLQEAGLNGEDVAYVAFYEKPFIKFERLLETYHTFAPRGIQSFVKAIPVWIKEKLYMKRILSEELLKLGIRAKLLFPEHHLSHAASAFYPSPFAKAAILTVDGVGEWATTTIARGEEENIRLLRELHFPHSLGLLYSAFTYYCGFRVNSGEYKLMGLAPYGQASLRAENFIRLIREQLIDIREDGSFLLNMAYFDYATGLRMTNNRKWESLFGVPPRKPESELDQVYIDMAYAVQNVTGEVLLNLVATARQLSGCTNLVMAGGVALNCVANGLIERSNLFNNYWIQPAAGDEGGALGAALAVRYIYLKEKRVTEKPDSMSGAYLGPSFPEKAIENMIRKNAAVALRLENEALYRQVASLLSEGRIIGWFQGRMEFGPRALGNRSILADPRNTGMQKKLNMDIKFRESFRPFAPSVLEEEASQYFDLKTPSPYMLKVASLLPACRLPLPPGYDALPYRDKLYQERSPLQAVTHVDFSARIQTVSRQSNPAFYALLDAFRKQTGCSVLVNTSFNVRGEPIVCSPEDAYHCFMSTGMDYLVIGNYLFDKSRQPHENKKGMPAAYSD
ncbi:MAG: carbamoyltransferase [Tannerellaceae bacterium]|jgi:carbamoyltransferase|nr:carbamoyltransferase [Tannerellaceae bacterium]